MHPIIIVAGGIVAASVLKSLFGESKNAKQSSENGSGSTAGNRDGEPGIRTTERSGRKSDVTKTETESEPNSKVKNERSTIHPERETIAPVGSGSDGSDLSGEQCESGENVGETELTEDSKIESETDNQNEH